MEKIMSTDTASVGRTPCTLEPRTHIWDLGGTMTATFADKTDPDEQVGFLDSDHVLLVTVTVTLTGKIRFYLCDTSLCVCLAFEACGASSPPDRCQTIELVGPNSPCQTNVWEFKFEIPAYTFDPGQCGREYEACITLGSRDCCDKVGFVFGSCHEFTITVTPPLQEGIRPLA
jgi:hypothetical protein